MNRQPATTPLSSQDQETLPCSEEKAIELISQFSASLFSSELSETELSPLLAKLAEFLEADVFTHFIRTPTGLRLAATGGLPEELARQLKDIQIGQALCGRSVAMVQTISLTEQELKSDPDGSILHSYGVRCYHVVPLMASEECIGSLAFASTKMESFSDHQKYFMQMVGHVISASRVRKMYDERRVVEEERYQNAAKHAQMVVWEADPKTGMITYVSGSGEELLGYPIEQWYKPRFWHSSVHPDDLDAILQACEEATKQDLDHRMEYRMIRSDGQIVWVDDMTRRIEDPQGETKLRGTFVNITNRKSLEQQLLQSQKMEAVGRLAGGIAHDFNNLLTVVNGSCDLIVNHQDNSLPHSTLELIHAIQDAGVHASQLTKQLLLFSSGTAYQSDNNLPQPTRSLDVNQVIQNSLQLLQRLLGESVQIEVDLANDLPAARVDPTHLEQIVVNLAVNARDAMSSGGWLKIETSTRSAFGTPIQEGRSYEGDVVQLKVSDTGAGISDECKQQIFDPFFTTKEVGQGTGLGLSVVYGIVSKAGGHIEVESQLGQGTEFKIILPSCRRHRETPVDELEQGSPKSGTELILLVEDEAAVRRLISKALGMNGYQVIEMPDGAEALQWAQSSDQVADLLLTDVIMPKMSGPELANNLAEIDRYHHLPVLYLSGYPGQEIEKHGVHNKTHNFLQKPFSLGVLMNKVREAIDSVSK